MTEQNISELETKILNCVHYSPHSMAVKPNQVTELIAYILSSQAQPTPSQSEPVALMNSVGYCAITLRMVKELEDRGNPFPYDMWPTKLYTSPQPTPSQSVDEPYAYEAIYDNKTCALIYDDGELDPDNVEIWGNYELKPLYTKPQPTSQGEAIGEVHELSHGWECRVGRNLTKDNNMIQQNRWVERGTTTMFLVGSGGKIIAEIYCIDYPMIWTFKNDKYISKEAAQEAAQKLISPN